MKKAYYYLFYKLYRFSEASPSRWLSDWKASLAIDVLILFVFSSMLNYYKIFLKKTSNQINFGNQGSDKKLQLTINANHC